MSPNFLLTTMLAAVGLAVPATAQLQASSASYSQVSLCITTEIGPCGVLCEPFQCTPSYTLVSSYENMCLDITGAVNSFFAVVAGDAVPGCLSLPGIEGGLSLWTPAMTLHFGFFAPENLDPDLPCGAAHVQRIMAVPFMPPGYDCRFQVLSMNSYLRDEPNLALSRPIEVRTR
jgi:hypothetical protein